MKKVLTAGVTLLSIVALTACSGKTASQTEASSSKASSSKVATSSSKKETSSSSSKASSSEAAAIEIVLLTDEEIDNARTIGDFKALYTKLADNYAKYANDIREKIPESQRAAYDQAAGPGLKTLEESKETFNNQLSSVGADSMEVPQAGRDQFLQIMKQTNETMKSALESAYKMVSTAVGAQ